MMEPLQRDLQYAARRLARDWRFSAGAIVILALGIGANTAVFSILNNTLFVAHPFADGERLVNIYQNEAKTGMPEGVSYPAFLDLHRETAVFSGVAASLSTGVRFQQETEDGGRGEIRQGIADQTSANFLEVIGMRPALGRWFSAEEVRRGERVAVLGWEEWRRHFGGSARALGQRLIVGGKPFEVIGVGPERLHSAQSDAFAANLWLPLEETGTMPEKRKELPLLVRGRLREGMTPGKAQAAMDVLGRRLAADYAGFDPGRGITLLATNAVRVHPRERFLKPVIATGMSLVGLVLAIACSNLATLLLVRASARTAEISIRLALGASRWQLVRHLLMESLLLSLAGAAAGVALTHAGMRYLESVDLPVILNLQTDFRVLGFAIGVATVCGLGFGLTPALRVTRVDAAGALREEKGSTGCALSLTRSWFTLKNGLVTGQVAASFLLLVGAALALGILTSTERRSVGYRPEGVAIVMTDPRFAGYDLMRAKAVFEDLRRQISVLPGVESAIVTSELPIDGQYELEFQVPDRGSGEVHRVEGRWAGPGYFQTMRIPLLSGRVFDERDRPESAEGIVVSEAFARRYFGTANAVGRRVRYEDGGAKEVEVIGVVGNARSIDFVGDEPRKTLYRPEAQCKVMPTTIVARTRGDEGALVGLIQQEIRRLRPELPVAQGLTMKRRQAMELAPFRTAVAALGALGGLGLLLAGVGLYAVVSYAVSQRSRELGIRIALGARPGDVTRLVVQDVTILVAAGVAIGGALSWAGLTVLQSSAVQIAGVNRWAVAGVALAIAACGAAAAYVPARRAVRTDPMTAIRHQ